MPAVQVRNLKQPYYDMLRDEAKGNGRSINKQLEVIVMAHFDGASSSGAERTQKVGTNVISPFMVHLAEENEVEIAVRAEKRRKLFERIDSRKLPDFPEDMDPATLVREMRDER